MRNYQLSFISDPEAISVSEQFERYVASHPADVFECFGLDPDQPAHLSVEAESSTVRADGQHVFIPTALASKVLNVAEIRQMSYGAHLATMVHAMASRRGLEPFFERTEVGFEAVMQAFEARAPHVRPGYIHGALRLLALQGWLTKRGTDEHATFTVTDAGHHAFARLRDHADAVAQAAGAMTLTKDLHDLIWRGDLNTETVAKIASLVDQSKRGWGIPDPGEEHNARRVVAQIQRQLDGVIVLPALVALGMPQFEARDDGALVALGTSLFDRLLDGPVSRDDLEGYNRPLLDSLLELLEQKGLIDQTDDIALTDPGRRLIVANCHGFAALPVSYFTTFCRIEEVFFADSEDQRDKWATDEHVNRVVNIWGIAKAVSTPRARELCDRVLKRVFDELPLDEQPAAIADMGCGDGLPLRTIAEYILEHTARGRALATHPLGVIAADYSEVSRGRAQANLAALGEREGVNVAVVFGDVTDPAAYDETISELGLPRPGGGTVGGNDCLHMLFHLTHDRSIRTRDRAHAREIIAAALEAADADRVDESLRRAHPEGLGLSEDVATSVSRIEQSFTTTFANQGALLPAVVAGADLVAFLQRWATIVRQGMVIVELHSPRPEELEEAVPVHPGDWMRLEKIGHSTWSAQYITDQFVLPYVEHELACVLAGLIPRAIRGGGVLTQQLPRFRERSSGIYSYRDPG